LSEISLRERLRAATSEAHAALDATAGGLGLSTRAGYGAFLSASASGLAPLEAALERGGVSEWLPDWPRRARREAVFQDLSALDLDAPEADPAPTPSFAFATGMLYVLEGSRLGARFLSRQVRTADPDLPLAYLTHGEDDDLWRSFVAWMEAIPKVGFRTDDAEAGARYAFQRFSDAFARVSPTGASGVVDDRAGGPVGV
jgi:heme oxygenase